MLFIRNFPDEAQSASCRGWHEVGCSGIKDYVAAIMRNKWLERWTISRASIKCNRHNSYFACLAINKEDVLLFVEIALDNIVVFRLTHNVTTVLRNVWMSST